MDGAHTHGHGPTGLGELVVLALGVFLAADILARVLTLLLIVLAVGWRPAADRADRLCGARLPPLPAGRHLLNAAPPAGRTCPSDPPRAVLADPVTLRQAITELQAQLLATRTGLPAADSARHQHLHFHGLTPEQAAAIITELQARRRTAGWQDGGSQ